MNLYADNELVATVTVSGWVLGVETTTIFGARCFILYTLGDWDRADALVHTKGPDWVEVGGHDALLPASETGDPVIVWIDPRPHPR